MKVDFHCSDFPKFDHELKAFPLSFHLEMSSKTRIIAPAALLALKDALASIYWKKRDLRVFVMHSVKNKSIVGNIDWDNNVKSESVSQLVERLGRDLHGNHDDLMSLLYEVSNFNDFSHLQKSDDPDKRITEAKTALAALRNHTKGFFNAVDQEQLANSRKARMEEKLAEQTFFKNKLENLKKEYIELSLMKDHQKRGFALERFLTSLFAFFELDPKSSFKIDGEQIDGLFTFQNTEYSVEAKWQSLPTRGTDLYNLAVKISGKGKLTMGLFVSINGFCDLYQGPNDLVKSIILMDGQDLMYVVDGRIGLPDLLYAKRRHLAAEGNIYLSASDVVKGLHY